MARKPAHLVSTAKHIGGRQGVWQAVRKLQSFTVDQIVDECGGDRETVRTYIDSLRRGGYLAKVDTVAPQRTSISNSNVGQKRANLFELVRDIGFEAPRVKRDGSPSVQGAAREQMWRTMKLLDVFSPRELALAASTDDQAVSEVDALDYARYLQKGGYLFVVTAGSPGKQVRYRFVRSRNSGPLPPQVQRLKSVWDPNTRVVVWQEEPSE